MHAVVILEPPRLATDFARGLEVADARRPVAMNQRSKQPFAPGIGPHTETATVALVMDELRCAWPDVYAEFAVGVPYPNLPRQKCDLCIGPANRWQWAIEVKLLRFLGDNGQQNDNILMHILSPYPAHRSALTDCSKLVASPLDARKAILIYGFEHREWPLAPAVDAFETLARARCRISDRIEATFSTATHAVHREGRVFVWELLGSSR